MPLIFTLILGIIFFSFPFYIFCIKCYIRISNLKRQIAYTFGNTNGVKQLTILVYSIVRNICINTLLYLFIDNRLRAHSLNEPPVTSFEDTCLTESECNSILKSAPTSKTSYNSMEATATLSQLQKRNQKSNHMDKQLEDQMNQYKTNTNLCDYKSSYVLEFNNSINIFWALAIQTSWYLLPVYQFVGVVAF